MKIKNVVVGILISIALVITGAVIITAYTNPQNHNESSSAPLASYSKEEVAKHAISSDCWIIISGGVYDVTSFIRSHPGGSEKLSSQCGKDATSVFESQDGQGSHSAAARNQLNRLKIGTLQ